MSNQTSDTKLFEPTNRASFLERILDDSPDMIIAGDALGRVLEFNKGAEFLTGYKKEEVLCKSIDHLYFNPLERKKIVELLEKEGRVIDYDVKLKTKSGQMVHVSTTLSYLRDEDNHIIGTVGIARDIRKRVAQMRHPTLSLLAKMTVFGLTLIALVLIVYLVVLKMTPTAGVELGKELDKARTDIKELKQEKEQLVQEQTELQRKNDQLAARIKKIDQKHIYLPQSVVGSKVTILKKNFPISMMLSSGIWEGTVQEVTPAHVILIDKDKQFHKIPWEKIGGYKVNSK
ncbi:MAG: PAS domain-containing protein [Planctomycetes bacterium]|nr:PAS domain-containing protein [Planctomycetota bacterium]